MKLLGAISVFHTLIWSHISEAFAPLNIFHTSSMKNIGAFGIASDNQENISLSSKLGACTTSDEIIPRKVLFGNPTYASPKLSPDGTYLSYLAPSDEGVLNVFVRLTSDDNNDQARMVTSDNSRGIRQYSWAPDGKTILYLQDFEGDENFHLWSIDATSSDGATARDLTPGENVKASNLITNKRFPDKILVATNERNPACFDMYRVDYKTGEKVLDTENPGDVLGWGSEDFSFEVREALVKNQEDSSSIVRVRDNADSEWRDLTSFPYGENGNLVDFCVDGKTCWMTSSVGRETSALLKVDLKTGETLEVVSANDNCDVGSIVIDDDTKQIKAVSYNYARTERVFFDKNLNKTMNY